MQTKRRLASLVVGLWLVSVPSTGWAEPPVTPPDAAKAAQGEALAEKGYALYQEGKYSDALSAYLRAYDLTGAGMILFNIANIYDLKLRELELASDYYRRYLRAPDATPELVRKANDRLEGLKLQTLPPPPQNSPKGSGPSPEAPAETSSGWRTAGLVVGGVGLVSLGVSGVFALQARSKDKEADKYCDALSQCEPRGLSLGDDAKSAATVSTITFAGGLVALAAGAAMFFAAPSRSAPAKSSVGLRAVPSLGPQNAGFALAGSW
jgi:tetratricopeptide (TPR) repeat protein